MYSIAGCCIFVYSSMVALFVIDPDKRKTKVSITPHKLTKLIKYLTLCTYIKQQRHVLEKTIVFLLYDR